MVEVTKKKRLATEIPIESIESSLREQLEDQWLHIRRDVAAFLAELDMPWWCQMTGYLGRFGREWCEANADFAKEHPEFDALSLSWAKIMPLIQSRSGSETLEKADSVENLRRMLLAMVDDPQVVVLVLCEFLARLRHFDAEAEETHQLARVVADVYAPLANRLGIWQLKWELEDLSLKILDRDSYRRIAKTIDLKREQRLQYLEAVLTTLRQKLLDNDVRAEVIGRPKHIYSIHKKMVRKDVAVDQIMDMHALRIICDDINTCYRVLGIVHTLWQPISNQFEDYIAVPKSNGYQSIHTGVIGPNGRIVEVQIRTQEMHEHNELGVAAHWRYKEGINDNTGIEERILWLRELLKWRDEELSEGEFGVAVSQALSDERIYIFTPKGQVLDLAAGATPLDFAYNVHTQVGHRCRGAKVNGRIVPLTYVLKTGEQVEILTAKNGGPSRDWMVPGNGYLVTSRARARVQRYFRELDFEQNVGLGRQILEKEMARVGLRGISHDRVQQQTRHETTHDEFLEAIGRGEIKIRSILEALAKKEKAEAVVESEPQPVRRPRKSRAKQTSVEIVGLENIVVRMARCCHPLPGDSILGYLTANQGITVHRENCRNMKELNEQEPERIFAAHWPHDNIDGMSSIIEVSAYDHANLVAELTHIISDSDARMDTFSLNKDERAGIAAIRIGVAVAKRQEISRLIKRIEQMGGIIYCRSG